MTVLRRKCDKSISEILDMLENLGIRGAAHEHMRVVLDSEYIDGYIVRMLGEDYDEWQQ
jgi:hypothetical protein